MPTSSRISISRLLAAFLGFAVLMVGVIPDTAAADPLPTSVVASLAPDRGTVVGSWIWPTVDHRPDIALVLTSDAVPCWSGVISGGLNLPFDGDALDPAGIGPTRSDQLEFTAGRSGQAMSVTRGFLTYATSGTVDPAEGAVSLWLCRRSGALTDTRLLRLSGSGSDYLGIALAASQGVLYLGGQTGGAWQSAYGGRADVRDWAVGEWHHVACDWSAGANRMRCWIDGRLVADSNEHRFVAPVGITTLTVGDPAWWIDDLQIHRRACTDAEPAAWAQALSPVTVDAVAIPIAGVPYGSLRLSTTTAAGTMTSAPVTWGGAPLMDPSPGTGLLPPGTTAIDLHLTAPAATTVRYNVGPAPAAWADMVGDSGPATTAPVVRVSGLDPATTALNRVWVRAASEPAAVLGLRWRAVADPNQARFPRIGDLWGYSDHQAHSDAALAKTSVWLGADGIDPARAKRLRALNPALVILNSINVVEGDSRTPEDYFLHDTAGNRVEVWPGAWRLNLTRTEVALWNARKLVSDLLDQDLTFDGAFLDNVFLTQSWQDHDIHGTPFPYDSDGDGVKDDPVDLDTRWRAGVLAELAEIRRLAPHALISGHGNPASDPALPGIFNGYSLGFIVPNGIEGRQTFSEITARYHDALTRAVTPRFSLVESAPPNQIGYGYGFSPQTAMPTETWEWARTWLPNMRYGLAFSLLEDGWFTHEIGDTYHGNDWWYDELDHDLGMPTGPASRMPTGADGPEVLSGGSFSDSALPGWSLATGNGAAGSLTADGGAAKVVITTATGTDWHAAFTQYSRSLTAGATYRLHLRLRAKPARSVGLTSQINHAPWSNCGLSQSVAVGTDWTAVEVEFTPPASVTDARLMVFCGSVTGAVWVDDVSLHTVAPYLRRRDFDHGMALLNPTGSDLAVDLEAGFAHLTGSQAPRHQWIVDDPAGSPTAGSWTTAVLDSGEWIASGPYFHDWGASCQRAGGTATFAWPLAIAEADTYAIDAWYPAAPGAGFGQARYRVTVGGTVVAETVLDQGSQGDRWHRIAQVALPAGGTAQVEVATVAGSTIVADALHLTSTARLNDGSAVTRVVVPAHDGMVLKRVGDGTGGGDGDGDGTGGGSGGSSGSGAGSGQSDGGSGGGCGVGGILAVTVLLLAGLRLRCRCL